MTDSPLLDDARQHPDRIPAERRGALLCALRGALTPDRDRALARALFDAEVADLETDAERPLDDLNRAAWLLTQVGEPEDVWRMARAKFANERTAAGFAGEHLLFLGLEPTAALLDAADHPLARRVFYYLFDDDGACFIAPDRLARWRRQVGLVHGQLFAAAA